jgi:hypothetical protein
MTIWKYDMCPHCGGDLFIARAREGWYERCVHCSYHHSLQTTNDLARALAQREKETSLADETSYGRDLTNCPYTAIRDESLLPSANLLDTTVRIRTASFSLN